ncbi:MinD/ParA family ATP-binding protein [Prescottella equi]
MSPNATDVDIPTQLEVPARGWLRGLVGRGPDLASQMGTAISAIRPARRPECIAVFGGKGGAGKTTTSVALGSVLAGVERGRVVAMDSNPDKGTLRLKFPADQSVRPLHELAGRTQQIGGHAALRPYLLSNDLGLEGLRSSRRRDPQFDGPVYGEVLDFLTGDYRIVVADCGTSAISDAATAVLARATQLVVVTPAQVDGFYALLETLDELVERGHHDVVASSTAVINGVSEGSAVDVDKIHKELKTRTRAVRRIPQDLHLSAGAALDFEALQPETKVAYAELAATVSARFR